MLQGFVACQKAAPRTIRNICVTLQSMWRSVRAWKYAATDIFDGLVLPKARRTKRFFFSEEEVQKIVTTAPEPYRTFYGLLAEPGLRVGELCGLTVEDLNLERGTLHLRQSAWRGKLGSPNNEESIRVVELSPQACTHLGVFLKTWRPNPTKPLFATRNGTPWDQNLLLKWKFRPLLVALGIVVPEGNGFHAFRHANASLMNHFGASHKLCQQRLGHAAGSSITELIYTHVLDEGEQRIAAQLGNAVWSNVPYVNVRENEKGLEVAAPKPLLLN